MKYFFFFCLFPWQNLKLNAIVKVKKKKKTRSLLFFIIITIILNLLVVLRCVCVWFSSVFKQMFYADHRFQRSKTLSAVDA